MKKYIISGSIALALMSVCCTSCEDFLDKNPLDKVSTSNFWNTTKDADKALTAAYSTLRTATFSATPRQGVFMEQECLSDNAISRSTHSAIQQGGINASTGGLINDLWSDSYEGIAACNYFLDNVYRVEALYDEADFNKIKGEALFLRSFFYNELVQCYGAVPLMLKTAVAGDGYDQLPRTPKADVVEQILKDVDFAIEWLPNVAYTDGHAVKGAAVMLKLRILLNNERYDEAAKLAHEYLYGTRYGVCPFSLADDYSGIFFNKQKNNPEIIFSVMFTAPDDFHALDQMVASRMTVFPSLELRAAYEPGDPRFKMTCFSEGDDWAGNPKTGKFENDGHTTEGNIPFTGMAFKKWIDPSIESPTASTLSDQDIVKMRYADLLLMYAEAVFESRDKNGDKMDLALASLNAVRQRSGVNMPPKTELTREIIRNERRVELAYEGLRWNDLKRWKIAEEIIPTIVYNAGGNHRTFDGYLWPIPQQQMDIMAGVWTQNEPW